MASLQIPRVERMLVNRDAKSNGISPNCKAGACSTPRCCKNSTNVFILGNGTISNGELPSPASYFALERDLLTINTGPSPPFSLLAFEPLAGTNKVAFCLPPEK